MKPLFPSPSHLYGEMVNKKLAHAIIVVLDILCLWVVFVGFQDYQHVLIEITKYSDVIEFGSRAGFFVAGLFLPSAHLIIIIEHFRPNLIKKYMRALNMSVAVTIVVLLSAGFIGSSYLRTKAENAGYVYCREASGISALARTLVYTRDTATCERLTEEKSKKLK